MFTEAPDLSLGIVVWLFSGPENTDDDYERYIAAVRRLDARMAGRVLPAAIQVVDAENPTPSARWRRKIADSTADVGSSPLFCLVSPSRVVRSIVTAINWIRHPKYKFFVTGTFDEALAWVESERGDSLGAAFRSLLIEARAAAVAKKRASRDA